jgi:hypothetical protein
MLIPLYHFSTLLYQCQESIFRKLIAPLLLFTVLKVKAIYPTEYATVPPHPFASPPEAFALSCACVS